MCPVGEFFHVDRDCFVCRLLYSDVFLDAQNVLVKIDGLDLDVFDGLPSLQELVKAILCTHFSIDVSVIRNKRRRECCVTLITECVFGHPFLEEALEPHRKNQGCKFLAVFLVPLLEQPLLKRSNSLQELADPDKSDPLSDYVSTI